MKENLVGMTINIDSCPMCKETDQFYIWRKCQNPGPLFEPLPPNAKDTLTCSSCKFTWEEDCAPHILIPPYKIKTHSIIFSGIPIA